MPRIKRIHARQIIDCKCRPAVEADVEIEGGFIGRATAPTGTSVGSYEAFVLRDGDPSEYNGLSVHKAVDNVNKIIAPALAGMDARDQRAVDYRMIELDGTPNKRKLGGNAIYSVSAACLRAAAAFEKMPAYRYLCGRDIKTVPVPSFNVINGGRQGEIIQPFNEFLLVPYKTASVYEAVEIAVKCFNRLEGVIEARTGTKPRVASSYGWAAPSEDPEEILALIREAAEDCGCGDKVAFALDCASGEMYDRADMYDGGAGTYLLKGRRVSAGELINYAAELSEKFPLVFVEDILDENDWDNFAEVKKVIKRSLILGDDLTATDKARVERAYNLNAIDGFVLKPNQTGTITQALEAHAFAKERGLLSTPSGRAGGAADDIVMDLAVGLEVPFIKNGAPRSGERIEKLNFLMRACDLSPGCKMADISGLIKF